MVKVNEIDTGKFKLDGGAMFGVVPKSMWSKLNPPDDNNMCTWAMRCLLVEDGNRKILIDSGIGSKQDEKFMSHFYPEQIINFESTLNSLGLSCSDITDVLQTHLHFDHVGGTLSKNEKGEIIPTFPNAKVWTNEIQYKWAINPNERERASFLKENILPLMDQGLLHFIDVQEGIEFSPHIHLDFVFGHTGAMMIPHITLDNATKIIFCADLLASHCHVGLPYIMAYDVQPLLTLKEKSELFEKSIDGNTYLFLEHDKDFALISVEKNENGKVIAKEKYNTLIDCITT
jgi:glyoxylase-like metal-dependent hydrolase (beta-lactamase superfamily II)